MLPPEMSDAEKQQVIASTLVKARKSVHIAAAVLHFIEERLRNGHLPVDGGRNVFARLKFVAQCPARQHPRLRRSATCSRWP